MKLDKDPFLVNMNMVELDGKKVLIRPFQAKSTKGKDVVIGDERLSRLKFQDQISLAKHSGAADEVWSHGYSTVWTQREGTGGPTMSRPTRPEDLGQEAHYQGSLKDNR
jgi:hypothetical protein